MQQFEIVSPLVRPPSGTPGTGELPIRSNRTFAIAVAISLGLGAVLMFVSLHHAASRMQAFS